jgi:hypothetical protein
MVSRPRAFLLTDTGVGAAFTESIDCGLRLVKLYLLSRLCCTYEEDRLPNLTDGLFYSMYTQIEVKRWQQTTVRNLL